MNRQGNAAIDLDYEVRQRCRDEDYRKAYSDWAASLPPEERRRLAELGLGNSCVVRSGNGAASGDLADSPLASCDPVEPVEEDENAAADSAEPDPERLHDLLRRMVGELIGQDNARLSLECLALVTGLAYCGDSMTEIAKRHGVTRAAVSKRCVELTHALNLKPSRAMRSIEARQSHRRARIEHLRRQS